MNEDKPITSREAQVLACPKCGRRSRFFRSPFPEIDSCGFESYALECKECGVKLAGIIDPDGEDLLLSELEGGK